MNFPTRFCIAVALVILFPGCWEGTTRAVSATVLATKGTNRIKSGPSGEVLSAQPGLKLPAGAVLQSAEGSQVDLALLPSCQVRLLGEGELIIGSLMVTKDGNETEDETIARRVAVSLNKGAAFMKHRRPLGSFGTLVVRTPCGMISSSSDCLIYVEVTPERIRLVCVRGYVEVSPASGRDALTVIAGSIAEVTSQTSSLTEVAADADAQGKVTDTLSAEEELLALTRARRNILPR